MPRGRKPHRDSAAGPSQRQLRAGEAIRRALVEALAEGHFRDPDLAGVTVTVTEVRCSPDLRHAFAFVLPLGGAESVKLLKALKRASAYLRTEVAKPVELRLAPEVHFELDRSFDEAAKIDARLRAPDISRDLEARDPDGSDLKEDER